MKFSLGWLKQHLQTEASLGRITETLSAIGLEVENVADRGATLAAFRTARIVEAAPHPNADRLRVCIVDIGAAETVSVVCGAPNARTGLHGVFAPPGAFIPGSNVTLKVGEIRGVKSAGMLLSLREMGLGEAHEGIAELPDGSPIGMPYAAFAGLDDPVIEIGVTPNRGDALAVRGVARDLAAAGLGTLLPWAPASVPGTGASRLRWQVDFPQACPYVLGRTINGVRNGPSPAWLRTRLESTGLRPINTLADITNFFTYDIGRPLHVFDADRVAGDSLTMRRGAGEVFRALNGRDYTCREDDLVIADEAGVVSLAGIVGGEGSGCTEATTTVFVECALFDPVAIALAGRRHQVSSDARQRFERGIDPALLPAALEAATRMILDLCGGEASGIVSAGAEPKWQRSASLRFERLAGLGGADVPAGEAVAILERLGFGVISQDARAVCVSVPPWRNDIAGGGELDQGPALDSGRAGRAAQGAAEIEPECDLVEEILRIRGLDAIASVSLPRVAAVPPPALSPRQARAGLARRVLAARGLSECVNFSFLGRAQAEAFGGAPESLRVLNPIASDLDQLRPTPLATLVMAAARNAAHGYGDTGLFEIGPGFSESGQHAVAAGLRSGASPRHWQDKSRPSDAMQAKADAFAVLSALGVPMEALSVTADAPDFYHPGRSGVVRQGPKITLARFGELHPSVADGPAGGFEIFLDAIAEPKRRKRGAPEMSAFQPLRRDFAFVVDRLTAAEAVLKAARGADRALISGVRLFDVFEGGTLPEGMKSLGVEVVLQPREATLTDAEIEAACGRVVAAVAGATGAVLR